MNAVAGTDASAIGAAPWHIPRPGIAGIAGMRAAAIGLLLGVMGAMAAADAPTPLFERMDEAAADPQWPGITIGVVAPDSPAQRAGARVGDRIVAIDGMRVHDCTEMYLLNAIQAIDRDTERMVVARDGRVVVLAMDGVQAQPDCGLKVLKSIPDADHGARALAALGVAIPAQDHDQVEMLPARVAHALDGWRLAQRTPPRDPAWAHRFLDDYLAAVRGAASASSIRDAIPIPALERVDRFWRTIIAERTRPESHDLPIERWGCDACYAALYYPFAHVETPSFGEPKISDGQLAGLLRAASVDPWRDIAWRAALAQQYVSRHGSDAETFLSETTAALLDTHRHGGWPYRSSLVAEQGARQAIVAELTQRWKQGDADADRVGYALIGPLILDGETDQATAIIAAIQQRSPYIAARAALTAQHVASAVDPSGRSRGQLDAWIAKDGCLPTLASQRFIEWCLSRARYFRDGLDTLDAAWAIALFHRHPDRFAEALMSGGWALSLSDVEFFEASGQMNNIAWRYAVDPTVADGDQARAMAEGLVRLVGVQMTVGVRDTVAACFARAGDYERARRWERGAIEMGGDDPSFATRLDLYAAGSPYRYGASTGAALVSEADVDGGSRSGRRAGAVPVGVWRWERADRSRSWTGAFDEKGRREGAWRRYDAKGALEVEAYFCAGLRFGQCRVWHDGKLALAGWYGGRGDVPMGRWSWFYDSGKARVNGMFLAGRRAAPWKAWTADGDLLANVGYDSNGDPDAAWPDAVATDMPELGLPPLDAVAAPPARTAVPPARQAAQPGGPAEGGNAF